MNDDRMRVWALAIAATLAVVLVFFTSKAYAERLKDIVNVQGVRSNQLIGYGLVVGLDGSGDQTTQTPFTVQSIIAMLHYLRVPEGSGTAFYRHRSTGIERVSHENHSQLAASANRELAQLPPDARYMSGSDAFFEQIGRVEAVPDRLIIYHGSLLHTGVIPRGMTFSADPREGRLTANLFIQGGPQ